MKNDHQPRESGKPVVFDALSCAAHKPENGKMKFTFRCHCGTQIGVTVPTVEASVFADDIKARLSN